MSEEAEVRRVVRASLSLLAKETRALLRWKWIKERNEKDNDQPRGETARSGGLDVDGLSTARKQLQGLLNILQAWYRLLLEARYQETLWVLFWTFVAIPNNSLIVHGPILVWIFDEMYLWLVIGTWCISLVSFCANIEDCSEWRVLHQLFVWQSTISNDVAV